MPEPFCLSNPPPSLTCVSLEFSKIEVSLVLESPCCVGLQSQSEVPSLLGALWSVARAVPSRMPSLRTANSFAPYKSTEKIHKSLPSSSLWNAHISEQQQKGFDFCFQYPQTSTLGRPSFPYCNRIPQLCYLRSRLQGLQVLNQSGYQLALILLTTLPLGDTKV